MGFDLNHRPPWSCPICNVWVNGRERFDHMKRHTRPETGRRIEEETGATLDDVIVFCLQNGIEIDDLAADDPKVSEVIVLWVAGDPLLDDDEIDRLIGIDRRPDPDIWGELATADDDGEGED